MATISFLIPTNLLWYIGTSAIYMRQIEKKRMEK